MGDQKITQHYVLFPNHENGMKLYKELRTLGVRAIISPTPRVASTCCGISLLVQKEDIPEIKQCICDFEIDILKIVEIEKDVNPNRDRYC